MLLLTLLALSTACAKGGELSSAMPETWSEDDRDAVQLDLVTLLVEEGAYEGALRAVAQLRADGVRDPRLDQLQARALLGDGRPEEALAAITQHRPGRDPEYYRVLGLVYLDLRRIDDAVEANRRGLRYASRESNPGARADLLNNMGFALVSAGRVDEGVAAYTEALLLDPEMSRCRNNLGFALATQGRDEEALAAFRLAQPPVAAATAREAHALANLALAQVQRGQADLACLTLERARSADPENAQVQQALGELCVSPPPEAP